MLISYRYWDLSFNNYNYSYVNVATDQYKYYTLSFDRLGIGNSSHGEPLNEIQSFIEIAATVQLTQMLRNGTFPGFNQTFSKVVHVGHSFGSAQTYALASMYPNITDGIVLTGFSMNGSFVSSFAAGATSSKPTAISLCVSVISPVFKSRMFSQCMWSHSSHTSRRLT